MIHVDRIIKKNKGYNTFSDIFNDYMAVTNKIEKITNEISSLYSEEKEDSFSLSELEYLYSLLSKKMTYDEEPKEYKLRDKMLKIFPELSKVHLLIEERKTLLTKKENLIYNTTKLIYDGKAHIYIPYKNELKCILSNEIITGCKNEDEYNFLIECCRKNSLLLKSYESEDDIPFINELLQEVGLSKDSSEEDFYNLPFDEKYTNEWQSYYDYLDSYVSYINQELHTKHAKKKTLL